MVTTRFDKAYAALYYDENGTKMSQTSDGELNGLVRLQTKKDIFTKLFREGDTRKAGSIKGVYRNDEESNYVLTYYSLLAYKFRGTMLPGGSERSWLDDYPIYRYADALLLLAEAKALLGEDIATEINAVREHAYGKEYFNANRATLAYPNDKGDFYTGNEFVGGDEDPIEAILKECFREFMLKANVGMTSAP